MSWWWAMLPRCPVPVPQPELPESPGAPRPGPSFLAVHKKKARPHMTGLSFAFRTQSGACSPELPRKSMGGEFGRMAGRGGEIGRLEIII